MTSLLAAIVAVTLAATQLALGSAPDRPEALPLLPVALVVAWAVVRHPAEAALALLPVAWVIGVASDQPAGWLLIALIPTLLFGATGRALGRTHAIIAAVLAGAASALGYLGILDLFAAASLPVDLPNALATAAWTGAAALLAALALLPFRPRERGLFG